MDGYGPNEQFVSPQPQDAGVEERPASARDIGPGSFGPTGLTGFDLFAGIREPREVYPSLGSFSEGVNDALKV